MMKKVREIAAAILIDVRGCLLLQQRDSIPGILQPGKIGLFGGHLEANETFLECVVREISEEISHPVPPERFQHLLSLDCADPEIAGGRVRGEFFIARDVPTDVLVITEGKLLVVHPDAIAELRDELTPVAILAIEAMSRR